MRLISLWIGKSVLLGLKLLNKRGAALPGLVVEKIYPNFLSKMLQTLPEGVVVISGTNGKTTTTKMLSAVLKGTGKKVLTNPTGSNFTRGVVAAIIADASWGGRLRQDIAIIELDEAYASKFVEHISPRMSVILNVMRDQMDRFGEIDHTARLLQNVVNKTTDVVILNRDDSRVYAMRNQTKSQSMFFGVSHDLRAIYRNDDELHGDISKTNTNATVELLGVNDDKIVVKIEEVKYDIRLSLYGTYNAQNACAVIATSLALGLHPSDIVHNITNVTPAFGRGERIYIGEKRIILQLVKNPGGFRHALIGATTVKDDHTMVAINDDYPDGRDVSWLWDVDFSALQGKSISTAGMRAADMALRLQYDEIPVEDYEQNLNTALKQAILKVPDEGTLHVYATYTAMLKLRSLLSTITEVEKV